MTSLTNRITNEKPNKMARVVQPRVRTPSMIIVDEDIEGYLGEKPLVRLTLNNYTIKSVEKPVEKTEEEPVITMEYIKSYLAEKPLPKPTLFDCLRYAQKPVYNPNLIRNPEKAHYWKANENTVRLTKSEYKEAPKTRIQKFLSFLNTKIF